MKNQAVLFAVLAMLISGCSLDDAKECKDGQTRCVSDDVINTCVDGQWWQYETCEHKVCQVVNDIAACVNICENGDKKCAGNALVTCENNEWPLVGVACDDGENCMTMSSKEGADVSVCLNPHDTTQIVEILAQNGIECEENLLFCGDDNNLYNCVSNELNEVKKCGTQVCDRGEDGIMACLDACTPGFAKCEGNNLVTCTNDRVFGSPSPCPNNTVCSLDKNGESACIERNQSIVLCDADKCMGNMLYHCVDGIWDNGVTCELGCGLESDGKYACITETKCEDGTMKCEDNSPMMCENGSWHSTRSCGENSYCVSMYGEAFCICKSGYDYSYEGACEPLVCTPGCSEDLNYSISCDGTMTYKTYCPFGCDAETQQCSICQDSCSDDGIYRLACMSNQMIEKSACQYGCLHGACIIPDSDGDGVADDKDACPYNGAVTDDETQCDNLFNPSTGKFSIYCAQNFSALKEQLDKDAPHICKQGEICDETPVIRSIEFMNDINLAYDDKTSLKDGCKISGDILGLNLDNVIVYGNHHKITASIGTERCTLPSAIFDEVNASDISDLSLDLDVNGGRGMLANIVKCSAAGEKTSLSNIHFSGSVTYDNAGEYIGGLVGHILADYPFSPMNAPWSCSVNTENLIPENVAVYAPESRYVGGISGIFDRVSYTAGDEIHRVKSVVGKSYVGGIFGAMHQFFVNSLTLNGEHKYMLVRVGNVSGSDSYIGGFAGYGGFSNHVAIHTDSIKCGENSEMVGGYAGVMTGPYSNISMQNIAVKTDSIEAGSYIGGFGGKSDNSGGFILSNIVVRGDKLNAFGNIVGGVVGYIYGGTISWTHIDSSLDLISGNEHIGGFVGNVKHGGSSPHFGFSMISVKSNLLGQSDSELMGGFIGESLVESSETATGDLTRMDKIVVVSSRINHHGEIIKNSALTPGSEPYFGISESEGNNAPSYVWWYNQESEETQAFANPLPENSPISPFTTSQISSVIEFNNSGFAETETATWVADTEFTTKNASGEEVKATFPRLQMTELEEVLKLVEK